jgi:hypothetical protein
MKLYYWINHTFFVIGLLFVGVLIHELVHHFSCSGGDLVAGFYLQSGRMGFGYATCPNGNGNELLAYLLFAIFIVPFISYKLFIDYIAIINHQQQ